MARSMFIPFLLLTLLAPEVARAAQFTLRATPENIGAGDVVRIELALTSNVPANAFSGALSYPPSLLEPLSVSDGNSVVNFWITRPEVSSSVVAFAGITPGGFSGQEGAVFSVLFRAKAPGTADLSVSDPVVLRNDGEGGEEPMTVSPLRLAIAAASQGGYVEPADLTPPEPFTVALVWEDGRAHAAFAASDKGSGIDRYFAAERRLPILAPLSWKEAASPHELYDQSLQSVLYVKAVDRSGNERVSVFPPERRPEGAGAALAGILVAVALLRWRSQEQKGTGARI